MYANVRATGVSAAIGHAVAPACSCSVALRARGNRWQQQRQQSCALLGDERRARALHRAEGRHGIGPVGVDQGEGVPASCSHHAVSRAPAAATAHERQLAHAPQTPRLSVAPPSVSAASPLPLRALLPPSPRPLASLFALPHPLVSLPLFGVCLGMSVRVQVLSTKERGRASVCVRHMASTWVSVRGDGHRARIKSAAHMAYWALLMEESVRHLEASSSVSLCVSVVAACPCKPLKTCKRPANLNPA